MNDRQRHATRKPTTVRPSNTRARRAAGADLILIDHVAECPDCGDYAHPTATVCAACGAHLYPGNTTAPARASLGESSVQGQKEAILMAPTGCTCGGRGLCTACVLAEYDGETAHINQAHDTLEAAIARPSNVTPLHPGWGYSKRVG